MTWVAYTLTYTAQSPLLVGDFSLGFIQRTRLYIPGWTLWGALTARLTRTLLPQASGGDYEAIGALVRDNLPTSYAGILVGDDPRPALPHFAAGQGWRCGPLPLAEFEARFLTSAGQTALAPSAQTAADQSLHETEVLSARDALSGQRVRWQFDLYLRRPFQNLPSGLAPDGLETRILAALSELTLGANRGSGLGRLTLTGGPGQAHTVSGDAWPLVQDDWNADGCGNLRAHVALATLPTGSVRGQLERIPRRLWKNQVDPDGKSWGPGQHQTSAVFYLPGSQVTRRDWQPQIGPLGVWQTRED